MYTELDEGSKWPVDEIRAIDASMDRGEPDVGGRRGQNARKEAAWMSASGEGGAKWNAIDGSRAR